MKKNLVLSILFIGGMTLAIVYIVLPEKKQPEIATWLWNAELIKTDTEKISSFVKEKEITTLYLQYSRELDYQSYRNFISKMTEADVSVFALDGSPTWATDSREEEAFLTWFTSYQRSSQPSEQFKGIHLDVEPYLQSDWEWNQEDLILQYQMMVHRVLNLSKELNVAFGLDIPFWFDEILFENKYGSGNLAQWIVRTVDEITIMAYRNYAKGKGGIIEISQTEISWADKEKKKIIIAVETVPLPERYTSFSEMGIEKMEEELKIIKQSFRENQSFAGVAIHHLVSWKYLNN